MHASSAFSVGQSQLSSLTSQQKLLLLELFELQVESSVHPDGSGLSPEHAASVCAVGQSYSVVLIVQHPPPFESSVPPPGEPPLLLEQPRPATTSETAAKMHVAFMGVLLSTGVALREPQNSGVHGTPGCRQCGSGGCA
jgi:hypothetical protein